MWITEHSIASMFALLGCYLLSEGRGSRVIFGIPIFYFLYKSLEKLPFRDNFDIHQELYAVSTIFIVIGLPLMILTEILAYNFYHKIRHSTAKIKAIFEIENLPREELKSEVIKEANNIEKEMNLLDVAEKDKKNEI